MPLMGGKSKGAFQHNIKAEVHAGKPIKQAVAIAYAQKRKRYSEGGEVEEAKGRLKKLLGVSDYSMGGEIEEAPEMEGDDFSFPEETQNNENDIEMKRKARLFSLLTPKFSKK